MRLLRLAFLFCALCAIVGHAHAQGGMGPGPGTVHSTGGGGGNVTPDPGGPGTEKYQATSNSFNYTGYTQPAGATNGLVCIIARSHASNDVTTGLSLTWGAQAMALRQTSSAFAGSTAVFLFGLRNPASGAQTLAVSATNVASDNFINCISFSNVNQTSDAAAFPNPANTNNASTLSITSANGHVAVAGFGGSGGLGTILGTIIFSDNVSGSLINAAADYVASTSASTTVGTSSSQLCIVGMDVSN